MVELGDYVACIVEGGVRQSGDLVFRVGDIYHDADLLQLASQTAAELLEKDPFLTCSCHKALKEKLDEYRAGTMDSLSL